MLSVCPPHTCHDLKKHQLGSTDRNVLPAVKLLTTTLPARACQCHRYYTLTTVTWVWIKRGVRRGWRVRSSKPPGSVASRPLGHRGGPWGKITTRVDIWLGAILVSTRISQSQKLCKYRVVLNVDLRPLSRGGKTSPCLRTGFTASLAELGMRGKSRLTPRDDGNQNCAETGGGVIIISLQRLE